MKVDYHIHTIYSDGQLPPEMIVKQAKALGYERIAITDHDNTTGLPAALAAGKAEHLKVIPGIELATQMENGIGLHLLGYGIDPGNRTLQEFLQELVRRREQRNERLLKVLNDMGYPMEMSDLDAGVNNFIGKPIFARAMVKKGYLQHEQEAFGKEILGSPQARAVRKVKPFVSEAIDMIRAAGGAPVLAHPIQTRGIGYPGSEEFYGHMEGIIADLAELGLEGVECYHPDQDERQSGRFLRLVDKYHLHITRGSDFHGDDFACADPTAEYSCGEKGVWIMDFAD